MASRPVSSDASIDFRPHQYLARENERPSAIFRIDEGWAYRFRLFSDGRRQITGLFLPGDYCEPQWGLGQPATQPIVAITRVRATPLACPADGEQRSDYYQHLWKALVMTVERQGDWLVSLGRKSAFERIAQLLCEIYERMRESGRAHDQQCPLPLTQSDIADITGLTPVHVNRTLQAMRAAGLIWLQSKWLRIPDLEALQRIARRPGADAGKGARLRTGTNILPGKPTPLT